MTTTLRCLLHICKYLFGQQLQESRWPMELHGKFGWSFPPRPVCPPSPTARSQTPSSRVWPSFPGFMLPAPGFQPHASNHEPLGFTISSILLSPPPSTPRSQTPSSKVWPSCPALMFHTSSPRLPAPCLKSWAFRILGPSMGPPVYQWYPSPGSSFTSMHPGSSPPWPTLQLEASKQPQTSIPPVPNPRVGLQWRLHLQASFFTSLAPGFQPHTSNREPSVFSFSLHPPSPPTPGNQTPCQAQECLLHIQASNVTPQALGFQTHVSNHEPSEFLDPLSGLHSPDSHLGIWDPGLPGQFSSSRSPAPGFQTAPDLQTSSPQSQCVIFISSR